MSQSANASSGMRASDSLHLHVELLVAASGGEVPAAAHGLELEEALRGHFDDHHGFICATMLRRIDALAVDIAALDARIADVLTPHLEVIDR
jgi:transposase